MRAAFLFTCFALLCCRAAGQTAEPTKVHVNGVDLHYVERGKGEPLIFLHGGQTDYRSWIPQMDVFAKDYRVISYSRRFNHPNDNPLSPSYRGAYTDAADLAAFVRELGIKQAHFVGTSAGALVALVLAMEEPGMVRSLVLAEPPLHGWAKDDDVGAALYNEFMAGIWAPAAAAFKAGDDERAMRVLVDGFGGPGKFDGLSPEARTVAMQNSRFFKAATALPDPFPEFPKDKIQGLEMPVLIVAGENTLALHKFGNEALARLVPKAERITIPKAGHASPRENPQAFNAAVADFFERQKR